MRLHPAVATALVLVGGVLLILPVWEWLRLPPVRSDGSAPPGLSITSLMSVTLGGILIAAAVIFSAESQPPLRDSDSSEPRSGDRV